VYQLIREKKELSDDVRGKVDAALKEVKAMFAA
jgi:hypothetical protein